MNYTEISQEEFKKYLDEWIENEKSNNVPRVQYLATEWENRVAMDNRTNDCWVESFKTRQEAIEWLNQY